jgi:hypothetical protein
MLTDLYQGHSQALLKLSLYQIADTKERVVGVTLPSQFTLVNIPAEVASLYAQYGSEIAQLIASGLVSASNPLEILAALLASGQVSNFPISTSTQVFGGGLTEFGANLGGVTGNTSSMKFSSAWAIRRRRRFATAAVIPSSPRLIRQESPAMP